MTMGKDDITLRLESLAAELERVTDWMEKAIRDQYDNILVSCSEAGRHLDVSPTTVSRYIREGRLHKTAIGQSVGIRLSEGLKMKTP